jgi:hypothetical protein
MSSMVGRSLLRKRLLTQGLNAFTRCGGENLRVSANVGFWPIAPFRSAVLEPCTGHLVQGGCFGLIRYEVFHNGMGLTLCTRADFKIVEGNGYF